ncbi:MAG: ribonuclease III [Patescibacteria group bacterium]|nr:ribonuclease III [Patescibacteria group bacterium]MDE1988481.1 ribonuclease III [Patescibacteria group bacterium]MDE2218271.1 ribonuclease III [Patescibacteria group bacterium]
MSARIAEKLMIDFSKFEGAAGVHFKDKSLLKQAFTHRSYVNESKISGLAHNERLEFLGDAVLELVVTEYLYSKYPNATEGDLTSYRSALVNAITLSEVARNLNVNEFLLLSKGEAKDEGRARLYILANTMEAIIGAIFIDQGYESAKNFISKNTFHLIDKIVENKTWLDSKSYFQEMAQERTGITPSYKTLKEEGPDHDKHFTVGVYLEKELVISGEGRSKQEAEQDAARKALESKGWMK